VPETGWGETRVRRGFGAFQSSSGWPRMKEPAGGPLSSQPPLYWRLDRRELGRPLQTTRRLSRACVHGVREGEREGRAMNPLALWR
jgi:hypothetical protein